ncbi:MAG: type VII toxin-antitoxin system MntA family adenylyltransferase antitoxin [Candidatus Aquicultor sp.]
MIIIENLIKTIKQTVEVDRSISLAYLFGSVITGKLHPESDIDIGILFDSCPDRATCAREALSLSNRIAKELETDKIDLVVLNTADPLLMFEVATKGMPVYERQQGLASTFKLKAIKMHMDAAKFFELDKRAIKKFLGEMKPGA